MLSMQSTQHVAEDCPRCSSCAELPGGPQGEVCGRVLDDAASDCSTVASDQEAETLIIFDWDDTLFPTSWMQSRRLFDAKATLSNEDVAQLEQMAERARMTLQLALQIGKVVIVTNAQHGWIQMSCTKFMPSLVSLLKTMDIVSARSTYEESVAEVSEWKRLAFEHEADLFYGSGHSGQQRNIVSVGDSLHELLALKSLTKGVPNCYLKSIKLLEAPSIEQLIEQHEVLVASLPDVAARNGDLDVEIGEENSVEVCASS